MNTNRINYIALIIMFGINCTPVYADDLPNNNKEVEQAAASLFNQWHEYIKINGPVYAKVACEGTGAVLGQAFSISCVLAATVYTGVKAVISTDKVLPTGVSPLIGTIAQGAKTGALWSLILTTTAADQQPAQPQTYLHLFGSAFNTGTNRAAHVFAKLSKTLKNPATQKKATRLAQLLQDQKNKPTN